MKNEESNLGRWLIIVTPINIIFQVIQLRRRFEGETKNVFVKVINSLNENGDVCDEKHLY